MDYLILLLNTYVNEKEIFLDVIKSRQIQLENEKSISKKEFYFNCRKVTELLKNKIDELYNKRQNELYQIIDLREAKGEPTENLENELNTLNKNSFPLNLLHLTNDKFRGNFYFTDIQFIETSLNDLQYISENEKAQVRNTLLPHWLYYRVEHEVIDIAYKQMVLNFEEVKQYEVLIKQMIRISEKIFLEQIAPLNRKEFISVINDQYNNYNIKCIDMADWLNATYELIVKGKPATEINIQSKSEFIEWYNKKIEILKPQTTQQNKDLEEYLKAYKQSVFNTVIDKQSSILYYGKVTADVLEQRNNELLTNLILKERSDLLGKYNKRLYFLTGNVMQLFKAVNEYLKTGDRSFVTKIKIKENDILSSLVEIKEVSKVIKHNILNDEISIAQKIKDYCILMFADCIDLLNKRFGIDIYKSPLNTHFVNVKEEFIKSINYEELKIINELEKSKPETSKAPVETKSPEAPQQFENIILEVLEEPQQFETVIPDDVKNSDPTHSPNDWNFDCFELFKYLIENYYKEGKRTNTKLICIWFYLNEHNPEKYNLKITKDNYKIFIKKHYGITITNTDKPANYDNKVLETLNDHRIIFEDRLK